MRPDPATPTGLPSAESLQRSLPAEQDQNTDDSLFEQPPPHVLALDIPPAEHRWAPYDVQAWDGPMCVAETSPRRRGGKRLPRPPPLRRSNLAVALFGTFPSASAAPALYPRQSAVDGGSSHTPSSGGGSSSTDAASTSASSSATSHAPAGSTDASTTTATGGDSTTSSAPTDAPPPDATTSTTSTTDVTTSSTTDPSSSTSTSDTSTSTSSTSTRSTSTSSSTSSDTTSSTSTSTSTSVLSSPASSSSTRSSTSSSTSSSSAPAFTSTSRPIRTPTSTSTSTPPTSSSVPANTSTSRPIRTPTSTSSSTPPTSTASSTSPTSSSVSATNPTSATTSTITTSSASASVSSSLPTTTSSDIISISISVGPPHTTRTQTSTTSDTTTSTTSDTSTTTTSDTSTTTTTSDTSTTTTSDTTTDTTTTTSNTDTTTSNTNTTTSDTNTTTSDTNTTTTNTDTTHTHSTSIPVSTITSTAVSTSTATRTVTPRPSSTSSIASSTSHQSSTVKNPGSSPSTTSASGSHSVHLTTSTFVTTVVFTSTAPDGHLTTVTTVMHSGTLVPAGPGIRSDFAHNPGAIAGVTVGTIIAIGAAVIWIFLAWRRHKTRELEGAAISAPGRAKFRPPLQDEDEDDLPGNRMMAERPRGGALNLSQGPLSALLTGVPASVGYMPAALRSQSEFAGSDDTPSPLGFGQAGEELASSAGHTLGGIEPGTWLGGGAPQPVPASPTNVSSGHGHAGASSQGHSGSSEAGLLGAGSQGRSGSSDAGLLGPHSGSSEAGMYSPGALASGSEGRAPSSTGHGSSSGHGHERDRQSSQERSRSSHDGGGVRTSGAWIEAAVPPSSYAQREAPRPLSRSPSRSSFLSRSLRWRNSGKRASVTPEAPERSPSPGAQAFFASLRGASPVSPAQQQPAQQLIGGPRPTMRRVGVPQWAPQPAAAVSGGEVAEVGEMDEFGQIVAPPTPWAWPGLSPGLTLPPLPSPAMTESYAPEGLLDPRIRGTREMGMVNPSVVSLEDHRDYTRPFNAFANNRMHSSATVATQRTMDTLDSDDGIQVLDQQLDPDTLQNVRTEDRS